MAEEQTYSNRQVERLLDEQSKDIKEYILATTTPILLQTQKTNGRVTKNEDDIVSIKVWRGWMAGGLAVIGVLIPIIVGLQVWMLLQIINIPSQVQTAIATWAQSNVVKVTQ